MRPGLWSARAAWLLTPWLLLAGCLGTDDDDDTAGDDDDATAGDDDDSSSFVEARIDVDGQVQEAPDDPGVFVIDYSLFGDEGLKVDVTATWSVDALNFKPATPASGSETTTGLSASPEGVEHTFRWNSLTDLGYSDKKIWFRLSGRGGGNDLAPQTIQIDVKNTAHDEPCLVEVSSPTQTDGPIPIEYTIRDAAGDVCDVVVQVQVNGVTAVATQSSTGTSDPLSDVQATETPVTRRFVWDSETDVGLTEEPVTVVLSVVAKDTNNERSDETVLTVDNNRVPRGGQLIFTEIMPWPEDGVPWIELYNTTNHTLDAASVHFTSSQVSTVLKMDQPLLVPAGSFLVISQSLETANTDWTDHVNSQILMKSSRDTISLWTGNPAEPTRVDEISYDDDNFAGVVADVDGHALGLKPELWGQGSQDTSTGWCLQDALLTGYSSDFGTPGDETVCLVPPAAP